MTSEFKGYISRKMYEQYGRANFFSGFIFGLCGSLTLLAVIAVFWGLFTGFLR